MTISEMYLCVCGHSKFNHSPVGDKYPMCGGCFAFGKYDHEFKPDNLKYLADKYDTTKS